MESESSCNNLWQSQHVGTSNTQLSWGCDILPLGHTKPHVLTSHMYPYKPISSHILLFKYRIINKSPLVLLDWVPASSLPCEGPGKIFRLFDMNIFSLTKQSLERLLCVPFKNLLSLPLGEWLPPGAQFQSSWGKFLGLKKKETVTKCKICSERNFGKIV